MEDSESILDIPNTKKIQGYGSFYRIRIGDYRLGMEEVSSKEIVLIRFLHRKDIYRYFPET
jgi:mRNA interferase RelE/StbE